MKTIFGLVLLMAELLKPRDARTARRTWLSEGWHPQEEKHRRYERWYWFSAIVLTFLVAVGAGASAIYAYRAATEAHEQAVQARRQADIAHDALLASTRARLKIVSIEDASVTRGGFGVSIQGDSTVFTRESPDKVWFNFEPHYKNYGLAPAQDIAFSPRIFVVGAGHASNCKESARGWMASEGTSAEVVFPQDDGGKQWVGAQVPLDELRKGAAEVHAITPNSPIYLGVVGCLFYQSSDRMVAYVTAFSGDLQREDNDPVLPDEASIYDIITRDDAPIQLKIKVKILNASAD